MNPKETLIFEIGTEELPAKNLKQLSIAFKNNIAQGLDNAHLQYQQIKVFATPRRLAILVEALDAEQPGLLIEKKGPPLERAFDEQGQPTKALQGFAESVGASIANLEKRVTDKGTWLTYCVKQPGKKIQDIVPQIIESALLTLPIQKRMRWGDSPIEFVRPVHWALLLYGDAVIPATLLGLKTDNKTSGHRFHHPAPIIVPHANEYESLLATQGYVIADFERRREIIYTKTQALGRALNGKAIIPDALLDEVTALVEWPVVLTARFDPDFLCVPKEALITAMQDHQKYFSVIDHNQHLLAHFIFVANIASLDAAQVIKGNERVMRARLSDAKFFYQTDLQHPLEYYRERLKHVLFQANLGSLYEKSTRIAKLAFMIAKELGASEQDAKRAGLLCKADLMSDMVGEFPELQGIMGQYYALHAKEPADIAQAIREHYLPRFAKDNLPQTLTGCIIGIADRLDTLVGIFGINKGPTGEKDPFALRRSALSLLKIILEKKLSLNLLSLLTFAHQQYTQGLPNKDVVEVTFLFTLDRLKTWFLEQGINPRVFAAVIAKKPTDPLDFQQRILAVDNFLKLPEAESLAKANKRVSKLLLKETNTSIALILDANLFDKEAERDLAALLQQKSEQIKPLFKNRHYNAALTELSTLQQPVDRFFDEVMVMVEDEKIRNNRLALLAHLRDLFLEVADFSLL